MNKVIQSGVLLLTLLIVNNVSAGTISESSLNKIMALSGLNKQVVQFPAMVGAGMAQARQQGSTIPDAEYSEMLKSVKSAFEPSTFLKVIGKEIKSNLSEADAKKLLTWYQSSLGRKITKAEEAASTPAGYQQMIKEAQSLLANTKRVNLAKEIDSLINMTDMTMQLQEDSGIAVYTAISSVMNPGKPVNVKPYVDQVSAQKQQMRAQVEQLVLLSFVYGYKDLDAASIKNILVFLKNLILKSLMVVLLNQ